MKKKTKTKLTKQERDAYSLIGKIGGHASFKKRGRAEYVKMGKKSGESRRKKKLSTVSPL